MSKRQLAIAIARGRLVIGIASVAAPGWLVRAMTGRDGSGLIGLFARMVGARDVGLGLGVVVALDRGAPVRGWLEASALADGADLVACLLAREHLPQRPLRGTIALAGSSALACAWLSRRLDPPPPADPGHPEAVATGHPPARVEGEDGG